MQFLTHKEKCKELKNFFVKYNTHTWHKIKPQIVFHVLCYYNHNEQRYDVTASVEAASQPARHYKCNDDFSKSNDDIVDDNDKFHW